MQRGRGGQIGASVGSREESCTNSICPMLAREELDTELHAWRLAGQRQLLVRALTLAHDAEAVQEHCSLEPDLVHATWRRVWPARASVQQLHTSCRQPESGGPRSRCLVGAEARTAVPIQKGRLARSQSNFRQNARSQSNCARSQTNRLRFGVFFV
eukprot:scaffold7282_cov113-Isochrysis_galbana.AAC.16